jgi:hypothetical protein
MIVRTPPGGTGLNTYMIVPATGCPLAGDHSLPFHERYQAGLNAPGGEGWVLAAAIGGTMLVLVRPVADGGEHGR